MISKEQIESLVRQRDYSLSILDVKDKSTILQKDIAENNYDFSRFKKEVYTQQGKKRVIYNYRRLSCEDILCQYLKKQLDETFQVKYASRNKIMKMLFNILPVIKNMNDYVIIRADFKSFFDSVLSGYVYDKYILRSSLKRYDKELIKQYIKNFKYCYAGLCLSNEMTEIICRDFDEHLRAKLSQNGMFFYERYVDDIFLIMNKYIKEDDVLYIINETIKEVFGNCPVELSMDMGKFSFIAKRNIQTKTCLKISFLGYEFNLNYLMNGKNTVDFQYGISEKKRRRYSGIIERAIIQYSKDSNIELLRQRIKIYSSRVIIARTIGCSSFDWLTKGMVANYNELQYHIDSLIPVTEKFLKNLYDILLSKHKLHTPYFMIQSATEESIYNIFSNMKRNRSIVFHENIGVSRNTVLKWMRKINPGYNDAGLNYYRIVADYLEIIKIG